MASIIKTPSGTWNAIIRKSGFPPTIKTFRVKRDADDWARSTEDDMVRGLYIRRQSAERLTLATALDRYAAEVTPTKKHYTQLGERSHIAALKDFFGAYSMSAVAPDLVAKFRDKRLADGKAANTVRLDLALLGHLYTVAMREWGIGLVYNPVRLVRKPSPGAARDRRLNEGEEARLLAAVAAHSNPMLKWVVMLPCRPVRSKVPTANASSPTWCHWCALPLAWMVNSNPSLTTWTSAFKHGSFVTTPSEEPRSPPNKPIGCA